MDNNQKMFQENTTDVKSHIPEQLIYDMLLHLPVRSLCRFKCVSKSFNATINMQLENKIRRKLIFGERRNRRHRASPFYVCDSDYNLEQKIIFKNQHTRKLFLCSDHNGLFLLSDGLSNFVLWNPFTKDYRILPTCPFERSYDKCKTGLGYDSVSDDHKVVLIHQGNVWILELRSNSWRKIDNEFFPDTEHGWSDSACSAHGNLHWLFTPRIPFADVNFHKQEVFSFDMAKEKFSRATMPLVHPLGGHISDLYALDGCLCVSYLCYTTVDEVHLYVSNKGGDDYTWSKLYSMQLPLSDFGIFNYAKVLGYSKEGNKILLDIGLKSGYDIERRFMISYDLKGKLVEKIGVPVGQYEHAWEPRMFDQSLVPVGVESLGALKPLKEIIYDQTEM